MSSADPDFDEAARTAFDERWAREVSRLERLLREVYGGDDRLDAQFAGLLDDLAASWASRSPQLKELDRRHLADPAWFESNRMLGGVCYVDRYAGTLQGLR